ncbi:RNA export factor Rsm1 [Schizosaccharomyces japonicus yFS275]|uniref:RNA export factor Rsm1 n=1 Tax=Schizosaccharomyces japonicus (strain yFS275 / FY16936) TaxID=402676 RepID=B6JYN6_SCHJY|nr:RNA export factor Rsm1 [Schizosaccharomyces japonicus yFS275]EEB06654.1 RNA export factor Rsm1 [Schizosaccharomyces japonicus yFS275]
MDSECNRFLLELDNVPTHLVRAYEYEVQKSATLFNPWSAERVLERLATYRNKWSFPEDGRLSDLLCSMHGWTCSSPNTLFCRWCETTRDEAYLLSTIDPEALQINHEKVSPRQPSPSLKNIHASSCPWAETCCASNVLRIYIPLELAQLPTRFESFTMERVNISAVNEADDLFCEQLSHKLSLHKGLGWQQRLILAVFGWKQIATRGDTDQVLECTKCLRRLGTWNFRDQPLNVISCHKSYCPYIAEEHDGLKTWQVLLAIYGCRLQIPLLLAENGKDEETNEMEDEIIDYGDDKNEAMMERSLIEGANTLLSEIPTGELFLHR